VEVHTAITDLPKPDYSIIPLYDCEIVEYFNPIKRSLFWDGAIVWQRLVSVISAAIVVCGG
jgi:hypothetical protein